MASNAPIRSRATYLDRSADPTFHGFAEEDMERPIVALFERVAQRQPDALALQSDGPAQTYRSAWMRAYRLAQEITVKSSPGQLVGIYLSASPDFAIAMLACL